MSNRFHNKWHRVSHFTFQKPGVLDAGWDPIASHESPFLGDFVLSPEASSYNKNDWSISARKANFLSLYCWGGYHTISAYSNFAVESNASVHQNLYVQGSGTIGLDVHTYGNISGDKNLYITGSGAIGNDLDVYGNITGHKNLYITGSGAIGNDLDVYGNITGHKNLTVSGNAGVSGYENVKEYVHVYGENGSGYGLLVDKNAVVSGSTEIGKSNSAISDMSMAVGSGSYAGLKAYIYTNTGNVTNSLTFSATPDWAVNDVVSIINKSKYPDAVTISAINGNTVTFSTNLPFTSIIEESDFDSKCAYVISKPDKGNVDIGLGSVAEGSGASALNFVAHAEGRGTSAFGQYSHAEGRETKAMHCAHSEGASAKATGEYSHAEGVSSESIGSRSHAEGTATSAFGYSSHAEGGETKARGRYSHAEGYETIAYPANDDLSGHGTHAEGVQTQAGVGAVVTNFSSGLNGVGAHAEGGGTAAAGRVSHAEGLRTYASGIATHAEGLGTIAQNDAEHGEGKYNKSNKTTTGTAAQKAAGSTIHSVGIGTSSAASSRANAFEIMQNGDIYMYNVGDYDGTNSIGSNKATDTAKVINNKVDKMKSVTRQELINLRTTSGLCPGQEYRITDYVATTNGDMRSRPANHPFDIIVIADAVNKLNEKARAICHSGDTYFPEATKFETWQVWYCIDNDTDRFAWADTTNGKGIVYRLIDEFNNDVPYDFKGLQFRPYGDVIDVETTNDLPETGVEGKIYYVTSTEETYKWNPNWDINGNEVVDEGEQKYIATTDTAFRYTFDNGSNVDNTDYSLSGWINNVYGNKIKPYVSSQKRKLNSIVFKGYGCYSNTFGTDCYSNTFGSFCYFNTFGNNCSSNIFIYGCSSNTFGNYCQYNTFGNSCQYNTFGNSCSSNTFGNSCSSNTFGNYCHDNTFKNGNNLKNYVQCVEFESGNCGITLNLTGSSSNSTPYRNVTILSGVNNLGTKTITDSTFGGQTFHTIFKPANSQEISI